MPAFELHAGRLVLTNINQKGPDRVPIAGAMGLRLPAIYRPSFSPRRPKPPTRKTFGHVLHCRHYRAIAAAQQSDDARHMRSSDVLGVFDVKEGIIIVRQAGAGVGVATTGPVRSGVISGDPHWEAHYPPRARVSVSGVWEREGMSWRKLIRRPRIQRTLQSPPAGKPNTYGSTWRRMSPPRESPPG